ncbi:uncharacterized protein J3R85_000812 [Psidium guajava]|nr:uncharacterized protein J3R85_000812 [Psidium guajava]
MSSRSSTPSSSSSQSTENFVAESATMLDCCCCHWSSGGSKSLNFGLFTSSCECRRDKALEPEGNTSSTHELDEILEFSRMSNSSHCSWTAPPKLSWNEAAEGDFVEICVEEDGHRSEWRTRMSAGDIREKFGF